MYLCRLYSRGAGSFFPTFMRMENGDRNLPIKIVGYNHVLTDVGGQEVVSISIT